MTNQAHETDVCIVGGGPAGMLLGLLLASRNIQVLVLEQHPDFEREYRGEVLMPRFAQLFTQLGLFSYMEGFPHTKLTTMEIHNPHGPVAHMDFKTISPQFPFAFWMPQPIFLDALHQKAKEFPDFKLWFDASAKELIKNGDQTEGVIANVGEDKITIKAKITVGADGRFSAIHRLGHFENEVDHHKFDVLWFSLPRPAGYESTGQIHFGRNRFSLVIPKYPDLIQCGLLLKPDEFIKLKKQGIDAMRRLLRFNGPRLFQAFADDLKDFRPFYPLQARVTFVRQWAQNGLLLIGDAAHTCSPVGAIGVSIALETAAVAAEVIAQSLPSGDVSATALSEVQRLREQNVREVQKRQGMVSRLLFVDSPIIFSLLPHILGLLLNLGIAQQTIRKIAVGEPPLNVSRVQNKP